MVRETEKVASLDYLKIGQERPLSNCIPLNSLRILLCIS